MAAGNVREQGAVSCGCGRQYNCLAAAPGSGKASGEQTDRCGFNMTRTLTPAKAQPRLRYALVIGLGTLMSQWMETPFFTF